MKIVFTAVCLILFSTLQAPVVFAKTTQEIRLEADQLYLEHNYKKAYKIYYKLAKKGDHYSQGQISQMYANGEGKAVDLTEAYAWSVLAAEGGAKEILEKSELLLQQVDDKSLAEKKAAKLKKKFGEEALRRRQQKYDNVKYYHKSGGCTGSRVGCG
jgi:TPR repeat protein